MNRNLITVQIVIWAVLGVILLAVLVSAIAGAFGGVRFGGWGKLALVREDTVSVSDITRITFDLSSMDVSVTVVDEADIRIVQMAPANIPADEYFKLEKANGELRVSQPEQRRFLSLFHFGMTQKLEVYLPRSYAQNLSVRTRSGNVTLLSELSAQDLSFELSSGNLSGDYAITGKHVEATLTSGNITLGPVSCDEYAFSATSGNINLASLKGSGEIRAISGNITLDALEGTRHDVAASSGDIRLAGFRGAGSVNALSGSIRVDCAALSGDLRLDAASGNIRVMLPKEASYELSASCMSGNINGNIDMSYSKNGRTATAKVGSGPYVRLEIQTRSGDIDVDQNAAS